jgi:hypothetical protein
MTTPHLKKSISRSPSRLALLLIPLVFACLALSSTARAVTPTPDGGYFGANTAEGGAGALFSLTTGTNNTALGSQALFSLTTAKQNTATGAQALRENNGDANTADGFQALPTNTTGAGNTATGWRALFKNTGGRINTATGFAALYLNTDGTENTAIGFTALVANTTGSQNTAMGGGALDSNTTGNGNTATGDEALSSNTTGGDNTAIGFNALSFNMTGSHNTALGFGAGGFVATANNVICIGASGDDVSNTCFIGNIRDKQTEHDDAIPVVVDSRNQLGTTSSSKRFKTEIKPMDSASESVLALRPVTFHYKGANARRQQFGLIAEEVAKIDPDLVVRDKNGDIYTVRYEAVNAMLLNEFLKEHQTVQELKSAAAKQGAVIASQQKQIEALSAGLQKVSAQLEASKPAPQVVNNP